MLRDGISGNAHAVAGVPSSRSDPALDPMQTPLVIAGFASALAVVVAAAAVVLRARRVDRTARDLARLVPDLARLLARLLRDRRIPLAVRARVLVAVAYNVQPLNLIPDFVPVIGLVDNVLVIAWALRSTVRRAGREAIVEHWPGTADGLEIVLRLGGLEQRREAVAVSDDAAPAADAVL